MSLAKPPVSAHLSNLLAITLVFLFLSPQLIAQQPTKCLAIVTEMKGDVFVSKPGSKQNKAVWGTQLFEGDKIETSSGSGVSLLFSNGNLINLGANSNIEISNNEKTKEISDNKSKKVESAMMANFFALTLKRDNEKEVGVLAGLRSVNTNLPVELISPCNTLIKNTKPTFSWHTDKSMDEFDVKLYNSKGLVWSKKVSNSSLEYPENEKPLATGETYFWHVEGEAMLESYKSLNQEFTVISNEKVIEVITQEESINELFSSDQNSSSYYSVLGAYYMSKGLLEDAIEEFKMVSKTNPGAALPHEILGKLYSDVGKKDLAISELQKALQLAKKEK